MHKRDQQGIHSHIKKEYSRLADRYDAKWSLYVERSTQETVARLALQPQDRLLDIGCGTGALLQRLSTSHPADRLYGVDPVWEMLAIARRRLPPATGLFQAWAELLPFEAEQFDVIVCCNMFHYLLHPPAVLHEMARVLRPDGRLIITDWCDDYFACRMVDRYLRLCNRAHIKVYDTGKCARLLNETGYKVVEIKRYKINWLWGLMTARATKTAARPPPDNAVMEVK